MSRLGRYVAQVGGTVVGTCNAHGSPRSFIGTWTSGSSTSQANGKGIVRVGDTGTTNCGHHIQATEGSSVVTCDGILVHREGDACIVIEGGTGTTISGSDYVMSF